MLAGIRPAEGKTREQRKKENHLLIIHTPYLPPPKTTTPVHGMGDGDDDDDFIVELQERCELGCVMGNADAVEDALDAGIDSNYVNADGLSMLFLASERGHTSVVRLLLERGADPFIGNSVVHATCLHGACAGGARTFGRVPGSGETSSAGEDEEGQVRWGWA